MILSEMTTMRKLMLLHGIVGGKAVEDFASGNPCVFETDVARPLNRLSLSLLPRQSGTGDPSPSNIRPLLPWGEVGTWTGGKNLLKLSAENLIYKTTSKLSFEYTETGVIMTLNPSEQYGFCLFKIMPITESLVGARFSKNLDFSLDALISCDENGDNRTGLVNNTISESDVGKILALRLYITRQAYGGRRVIENAQVEVGNTPTAFVPYTPITPHPVNVGKNLFDKNSADDEYMFLKSGVKNASVNPLRSCIKIPVKPNTSYYLISKRYENVWNVVYFAQDGTGLNSAIQVGTGNNGVLFTTPIDCYYVGINMLTEDKGIVALNYPSTETDYQPYLPPVYGASIDLTTGEVWGTWKVRTFTGASSENWYFTQVGSSEWYRAYINMPDMKQENDVSIVADSYKTVSFDNRSFKQKVCMASNVTDNPQTISIVTEETSVNDFKAYLAENPLTIAYQLATPVLLATLTPQQISALVGVNTVWSDADGIDLTYLKKG